MSSGRPSKMSAAQRRNGRNVLIIAIILVGVTAFSLFHGGEAMELGFEDDKMTITGPEGAPFVVTISYQDIRSVSERSPADALELGACQEGLDTSRCRFGTWSNDAYGDYTLCASPVSQAISCWRQRPALWFSITRVTIPPTICIWRWWTCCGTTEWRCDHAGKMEAPSGREGKGRETAAHRRNA